MIEEHNGFDRVVILGDESANWQIAGLRQLDRLVLGLDEFAKAMGTANKIEVVVFWKPEIPLSERLLPKHQRITRVRLTEASGSTESTHSRYAVVYRAKCFVEVNNRVAR